MNSLRRLAASALLLLVAAVPGFAQGTTGAIEGKVADPQRPGPCPAQPPPP